MWQLLTIIFHCHQTALHSLHCFEVSTRPDLSASQVSTTLSLTWTLTRNGLGHEALSRTGSTSTELTAVVLTTPLTGKHNLAEPGLLNSAIVYSSFLPDLTSSGRSQLGLTPGGGSTPSARGSWSKTGRGTGLPWTTSSSTDRLPNCENPTTWRSCDHNKGDGGPEKLSMRRNEGGWRSRQWRSAGGM